MLFPASPLLLLLMDRGRGTTTTDPFVSHVGRELLVPRAIYRIWKICNYLFLSTIWFNLVGGNMYFLKIPFLSQTHEKLAHYLFHFMGEILKLQVLGGPRKEGGKCKLCSLGEEEGGNCLQQQLICYFNTGRAILHFNTSDHMLCHLVINLSLDICITFVIRFYL